MTLLVSVHRNRGILINLSIYSAGARSYNVSYFHIYSEALLYLNSLNWILLFCVFRWLCIWYIILSMQVRCFREKWIISLKGRLASVSHARKFDFSILKIRRP